jgi:hypothetical protein
MKEEYFRKSVYFLPSMRFTGSGLEEKGVKVLMCLPRYDWEERRVGRGQEEGIRRGK